MKREDVEKAAKEAIHKHYNCNGDYPCTERDYCIFCNGHNTAFDCQECGADNFNEGFIAGADWRISSVWHDVNEKIEHGRHILVQFAAGNFTSWYSSADIMRVFKWFNVIRWAYIDDLLPNKED